MYADFYFRMKRQDAVCIAGWTMGDVGKAVLQIGGLVQPATAVLTHQRRDLPPGAVGFILRFELGGEILDVETTRIKLDSPERTAPFPAASANMDALIGSATDDLFLCMMMGVADGVFAIEEPAIHAKIHARALSMAAQGSFAELTGAAVAQDQALLFSGPSRILLNGWMADDGKAGVKVHALVMDQHDHLPIQIFRESLLRPDLAGAQIRALKVGVSSGFLGTARLDAPLGYNPVCLVGMIQNGQTVGTLRAVHAMNIGDLGGQFDHLRRNLVDAGKADAMFANLLPTLPNHLVGGEPVDRVAEPKGLAYVMEQDLDHWLGRDAVRLVRRAEPGVVQVSLITETASEGLIRSTIADRIEAGADAPRIELVTVNSPLARWAPDARHLIVSTAVTLFQINAFPILAKARADGLGAVCVVMVDDVESGPVEIAPEVGIESLLSGKPFVAQLDQVQLPPTILPESTHVSQTAQMRWLMISLGRAGLVSFVGQPGLAFMPGRDPVPAQSRMIELRAMRLAAEETVQ